LGIGKEEEEPGVNVRFVRVVLLRQIMSSDGDTPKSDGEKPRNAATGFFMTKGGKTIEIRDVWASNLDEEMEKIRDCIEKYPYVAMVRC
jgi:hypothetical protein